MSDKRIDSPQNYFKTLGLFNLDFDLIRKNRDLQDENNLLKSYIRPLQEENRELRATLKDLEFKLEISENNVSFYKNLYETERKKRLDLERKIQDLKLSHEKEISLLEQSLQEEISALKAKIKDLVKELYGKKSEKVNSNGSSKRKKKGLRGAKKGSEGHGRSDYSHLPTVEYLIELPLEERKCKTCGAHHVPCGTEESVTIEVSIEVKRVLHKRQKYIKVCDCPDTPLFITAPAAPKLFPKSVYGDSVWNECLLQKFANGMPITRKLNDFVLNGIRIPVSTVINGMEKYIPILKPIFTAISERNKTEDILGIDETGWKVFEKIPGKKNFRWWLWVFRGAETIVYLIDPNGSERALRKPVVGRKNYYGSVSEWAAILAMMTFTIFETLGLWNINSKKWLSWYTSICAQNGGEAPKNIRSFLPWNMSKEKLKELEMPPSKNGSSDDSS